MIRITVFQKIQKTMSTTEFGGKMIRITVFQKIQKTMSTTKFEPAHKELN